MTAATPVRGIAFDWGGVFTVGTFDGRAIVRLAALYGLEPAAVRAPYLERMEAFEIGGLDLPGFQAALSRDLGREVDAGAFRTAFLDAPLERAATYALLAGIPGGFVVGMLSNNVPVLCDRVRDDVRTARIERFVFSNEIGVRKPEPAAFAALEQAMGLEPAAIVFVDDAPGNVEAARTLGFQALLIDRPAAFAARWRAALPDLAHLVDAPGWGADDA
ncbi:MAG: HAD-IA family hydrolase [Trueperaceae bacterium]|nr:HAD-IA family hydrolase [Trueperaceae bacterium]